MSAKLDVVAGQVTDLHGTQTVSTVDNITSDSRPIIRPISTKPTHPLSDNNSPVPSTSAQPLDRPTAQPSSASCQNTAIGLSKTKNKPVAIKPLWLAKNLDYRKDITFFGNATLPQHILNMQTPYQLFTFFIVITPMMMHICIVPVFTTFLGK